MVDEAKLTKAASEWRKTKFKISSTKFEIKKLPVMDAVEVFEEIRESIGQYIETIENESSIEVALVKMVLAAPRDMVRSVRQRLFYEVKFQNANYQTPVPIMEAGEESAFEGLNVFAVYEVFIRALSVNFFDSFQELNSRFNLNGPSTPQLAPQTSTPS